MSLNATRCRYGLPASFSDSDDDSLPADSAATDPPIPTAQPKAQQQQQQRLASSKSAAAQHTGAADTIEEAASLTFAGTATSGSAADALTGDDDADTTGGDSAMFDDDVVQLDATQQANVFDSAPLQFRGYALAAPQRATAAPPPAAVQAEGPRAPSAASSQATLFPAVLPDAAADAFAVPQPARQAMADAEATSGVAASEWLVSAPMLHPPPRQVPEPVAEEDLVPRLHPDIQAMLGIGTDKPTLIGEMTRSRRFGASPQGLIACAPLPTAQGSSSSTAVQVKQLIIAPALQQPLARSDGHARCVGLLRVHAQYSRQVGHQDGPVQAFECAADALPCHELQQVCQESAGQLRAASEGSAAPAQAAQAAAQTFALLQQLFAWQPPLDGHLGAGQQSAALQQAQRKKAISEWLEDAAADDVSAALDQACIQHRCLLSELNHCRWCVYKCRRRSKMFGKLALSLLGGAGMSCMQLDL